MFTLFLLSPGGALAQSEEAQSILEENEDFVIALVVFGADGEEIANGTGFFIGEGVLVTNYHLISQAVEATGINSKGRKIKIEGLLVADKNLNFALLKTRGRSKIMPLGDSDELAAGRKIFAMGSSPDGAQRVDEGTVGNALELSAENQVFEVTVNSPEIFTGGPIFNQSGGVVGVHTFIDLRTQIILPINVLKNISQSGTPTPLASSPPADYFETYEGANFAGKVFLALDNSYQAENYLRKVSNLKPDDIDVQYQLADIYMSQRNYSSAESTYNKIIELNANSDSAYFGLGVVYLRMLKWQESIAPFERAVELNPENIKANFYIGEAYYELRDFTKAAEYFRKYIDLNPPDIAEAYKRLAISLFESEQFAEAAPAFQEAIKAEPEDITLNYKLAQSFQKSEQYDRAEQIFLMLTELSPKDLTAYHNTIVLMYDEAKMPEKAVSAARRLVELDPSNSESQFNLGYMLIKQQNFTDAAAVFQKVIELNPSMEYAYLQLGYCYTQLKQYQNAANTYKQLVDILPENVDAWLGIAIANMQQKKWSPAVEPLRKVIELNPDNGNAYYNLGICYLNLKDNFSAREVWEQLRKIDQSLANKLYQYIK